MSSNTEQRKLAATVLPFLARTPAHTRRVLFWDPMIEPYRDDPRFQQLMVKLNCVEEYTVARETLARMVNEREATGK